MRDDCNPIDLAACILNTPFSAATLILEKEHLDKLARASYYKSQRCLISYKKSIVSLFCVLDDANPNLWLDGLKMK